MDRLELWEENKQKIITETERNTEMEMGEEESNLIKVQYYN